jgi:hypothetical protein
VLKKLLKTKKGTAEIVGTALFLVILFFFFSNVFLWHNRATREMEQVVADKMNSAVRIETTIGGGTPTLCDTEQLITYDGLAGAKENTTKLDGASRKIKEKSVSDSYQLEVNYNFTTSLNSPQKMRLVAAVAVCVYASYVDADYEGCYVAILFSQSGTFGSDSTWISTGLTVISGFRWANLSLSSPRNYIDMGRGGRVSIKFIDSLQGSGGFWGSTPDGTQAELQIDYMEVRGDPVALKVTNLGGLDVVLSRLWITNSTETANPDSDHLYADLEPLNEWVSAGARQIIVLSDTTEFSGGSLAVAREGDKIRVQYVPPPGQTITFKILTRHGNTAACSYSFLTN